jgi:hypothetical protein
MEEVSIAPENLERVKQSCQSRFREGVDYHVPLFSKTEVGETRWKLFCNNKRNEMIRDTLQQQIKCRTCKDRLGYVIMEREGVYLNDWQPNGIDQHKLYLCQLVNTYEWLFISCKFRNQLEHLKEFAACVREFNEYVDGFCSMSCEEIYHQKYSRT